MNKIKTVLCTVFIFGFLALLNYNKDNMSIIKHPNQRVGVFIDAQNLYHSGRNLYGKRVNFKNIMDVAISGRSLIRSLAYVITTEAGDEKNFFDALTKLGVETKAKDLQIFSGGAKKGDWDVGLAIDAVTLAPKLDTVVLVTGDGDFVPLVEYLKKHSGCQVEVISFSRSSSSKLIEACDDFYDMCENPNEFLIHSGRKYSGAANQHKKVYPKNLNSQESKEAQEKTESNKKQKRPKAKKDNNNENEERVVIERPKLERVPEIKMETKVDAKKAKKTPTKKKTSKKDNSKSNDKKEEVKKGQKQTIKKTPLKRKAPAKKKTTKKNTKKKTEDKK